jgi:hypothetical protein
MRTDLALIKDFEIQTYHTEFPDEVPAIYADQLMLWFAADSTIVKYATLDKAGTTKAVVHFKVDGKVVPSSYTFQQLVQKAIAGNRDSIIWRSDKNVAWTNKLWEPQSIKKAVRRKVIMLAYEAMGLYYANQVK